MIVLDEKLTKPLANGGVIWRWDQVRVGQPEVSPSFWTFVNSRQSNTHSALGECWRPLPSAHHRTDQNESLNHIRVLQDKIHRNTPPYRTTNNGSPGDVEYTE